jgi:hypothetical protein
MQHRTLACFACTLAEPISGGVVVESGLRSSVEERWFAADETAGSGELSALREADPGQAIVGRLRFRPPSRRSP